MGFRICVSLLLLHCPMKEKKNWAWLKEGGDFAPSSGLSNIRGSFSSVFDFDFYFVFFSSLKHSFPLITDLTSLVHFALTWNYQTLRWEILNKLFYHHRIIYPLKSNPQKPRMKNYYRSGNIRYYTSSSYTVTHVKIFSPFQRSNHYINFHTFDWETICWREMLMFVVGKHFLLTPQPEARRILNKN